MSVSIYEVIQRIQAAGFTLKECNGLLSVEPADKLTDSQRQWIAKHERAIALHLKVTRIPAIAALVEMFQADVKSSSTF